MRPKPPAAALDGEGNLPTTLELMSTFIHYVLGKKDGKLI